MNKFTTRVVQKIHKYLEVTPGDPRTTMGSRGYYIPFSFYENTAPNTLHFIIIILVVIFLFFKREK